ncbi:MAG: DeoR/GlpR transcriptional regulator [Bacillaceae bacterium]|nr:DeoR/GlpR transcriptional regulator [Bacillaceae bacterium]
MSISFVERKRTIMNLLEREEKVKVQELARLLQVSDETIRRDLERLEKEGLLSKVYGGAVREKTHFWELPFEQKTTLLQNEKKAICRAAANLVEDGDIIMVGFGSTTVDLVRFLRDRINVTLITNSPPVLMQAMEMFQGRVIFTGGELEREQKLMVGPLAERTIEQLKANKAFISAGGISTSNGITDYDLNGASVSRKMMEQADEVIVLADHTKFGKTTFASLCKIEDASRIITDKKCSREWSAYLAERDVELLIAE